MRFSTIVTLLLPTAILAAPTVLEARAAESCAPSSYTLSKFNLQTSDTVGKVNFEFKSQFANATAVKDAIIKGVTCQAEGPVLPNSGNVCGTEFGLQFDLRAPQDKAHYQITHSWHCNDALWMSGNDVTIDPLECSEADGLRTCTSPGPQTIVPQNVRLVCSRRC
ncbi:hypothetical protein BDU57DRAFT_351397 [Ampelomyces quisqualis]|uniref:AA1-like domain-containing protein n=1 Tax=Ampelomyces quisqualis TaxID=50730 RepID=A0A6A5QER8_AMPQU|nr:hypothetical protein BDU57DRAFT_351397 [Ampelomyces quisqualis]